MPSGSRPPIVRSSLGSPSGPMVTRSMAPSTAFRPQAI